MLDPRIPERFPAGLVELYQAVSTGEPLPREFDHVWQGSDSPHIAYPLRAIADLQFKLVNERTGEQIGRIEHEKAIREACPGATYLHFGQAYRVIECRASSYEHSILLRPVRHAPRTHTLLSTHVSVSTAAGEVIRERLLEGPTGILAEIQMRVADSAVGYRIGNTPHLYSELSKKDRRMKVQRREFSTTGVLLRLSGGLFDGDSPAAVAARLALADAVTAVAAREFSIAPAEVRTAHINIASCSQAGRRRLNDAVVIFDNVSGGVRLTAPFFDEFETLIERLERGVAAAADDAVLDRRHVEELRRWFSDLVSTAPGASPAIDLRDREYLVWASGSVVGVRTAGLLTERRVVEPQFLSQGTGELLMYLCESAPGSRTWVAHDKIEPIGDDCRLVIWNPATNTFREIPE